MTWRDKARAVVARTLAALPPGADARAALRDAYPFGPRECHPYRIWCDEVRRALGAPGKPPAGRGTPRQRMQERWMREHKGPEAKP